METKSSQSGPPAYCVYTYKLKDEPGLNFPYLIKAKCFVGPRYPTVTSNLDIRTGRQLDSISPLFMPMFYEYDPFTSTRLSSILTFQISIYFSLCSIQRLDRMALSSLVCLRLSFASIDSHFGSNAFILGDQLTNSICFCSFTPMLCSKFALLHHIAPI